MKNILKSFLSIAIASLATNGLMAQETKAADHAAHAGHSLKAYVAVADSLYKDDLGKAKKAATGIIEVDANGALAKSAKSVADAKDIAAAREAFKTLSADAVKLAKMHKVDGYTVMACPMVKDGKGVWLSADSKVNNPYFGAKMAHCGGPKK
ncbi:MAG: DUF3347 domain-containing protein [Verrucomicrobiales bacterium]|nr:DUF3347 domain-containing protein [Verrucomicrobiae bacterium]